MIPATFQPSVTYSSASPRRSSRACTGSSAAVTPRSSPPRYPLPSPAARCSRTIRRTETGDYPGRQFARMRDRRGTRRPASRQHGRSEAARPRWPAPRPGPPKVPAQFPDLSFHPRLRGRYGPPGRTGRMCLAFSFGGGRLGQHRPGELPRLSHREACPPGAFAARALPEADEDPRGGMTRIAEREPADRDFPPAARTQVLVPSIRTRARLWTWPHHAPPGFRPAAAAYTPAGLGNNRGAVIPACARHAPNRPGSPATIRRRPVRAGRRGPGTPAAR